MNFKFTKHQLISLTLHISRTGAEGHFQLLNHNRAYEKLQLLIKFIKMITVLKSFKVLTTNT